MNRSRDKNVAKNGPDRSTDQERSISQRHILDLSQHIPVNVDKLPFIIILLFLLKKELDDIPSQRRILPVTT